MPRPSANGQSKGGIIWAPPGTHPADMAGVFKDDPAFEEFCEILRQQREEDLRQTLAEYVEEVRREEEAKGCSSSTPTSSPYTKTRTRSSRRK